MKITQIEQFKVAVSYIEGIQKYRPTEHVEQPILIVKIHTDEGIVDLGVELDEKALAHYRVG